MVNTVDIPHEIVNNGKPQVDTSPDIVVLKFADSAVPVFKETRNKDYIRYGEDNRYAEYLTYLFNKSGKHNAIITGKADYIFGKGFENGETTINRLGESLNDVSKKAVLDIEIYGGYRLEVIWNRQGKVGEVYHVDYTTIRVGKDHGFYFRETWDLYDRVEDTYIPAFDPTHPVGSQIYAYNEYRPMTRFYPLPSYIGCNNYVETDIEISKFYLSSIRNGMMPSKMIQFFQGEPTEDKKRETEGRFKKKFGGAENAGKFILVFGTDKSKSVEISDLSASDLDKMFIELNKTVQQEIFSGHKVTSPMLFGIKTEGQLGGNTELRTAYDIFINTYAKPKATAYGKEIQYLFSFSVWPGTYELRQSDPIGWSIPDEVLKQAVTPDEVRKKLGLEVVEKVADSQATRTLNAIAGLSPLVANKIMDNLTKNEIRGLAALPPLPDGDVVPGVETLPAVAAPGAFPDPALPSNDNIKNLTGRQYQNVIRIIREYGKGKLTPEAAKSLLRTGLGLTEEDINELLGIHVAPAQMSAVMEEEIIAMFDACGDSKNDYEIIKTKRVSFALEDIADHEEAFKVLDVTNTEAKILELIKKDKRITAEVIAKAIGETKAFVESKISNLIKRGYLETTVGVDEIIERFIPKDIQVPPPTIKSQPVQILIKYSYEVKPGVGPPIIPTSRPFCIKMIGLNRLYSRAEIETISQRLGYSVFERKGGWWGNSPECRHRWFSHLIVRKREVAK